MKILFFLAVLFISKVNAFDQAFLLQRFAEQVEQGHFSKAFEWLKIWGDIDPKHKEVANRIEQVLSDSSAFENSDESLGGLLEHVRLTEEDLSLIKNLRSFLQETRKLSYEGGKWRSGSFKEGPYEGPYRQPAGVAAKYWTCVAGVVAGILLMPIYPPAGSFLIGTAGATLIFDCIPTAIGNKIDYNRSYESNTNNALSIHGQIRNQLSSKIEKK